MAKQLEQLAGTATKASLELYQFFATSKNAPQEIMAISRDIKNFNMLVNHLQSALGSADVNRDEEIDRAMKDLLDPMQDCQQACNWIKLKLSPHRSVISRLIPNTRLLLKYGADPDMLMIEDVTPLHLAAAGGWVDGINLLLDNDASINCRDTHLRDSVVLRGLKFQDWGYQKTNETESDIQDTSASDNASGASVQIKEAHILQERRIGVWGAISLVVNKIVGAGIFSTPATIFQLSGSPGLALILWVIAGAISTCGALVMLEFGIGIPRSGGMKIYLERSFSPKLLMTCVYLFYCVFLQNSASNAITASSYLLEAAGVDSTTWKLRGLAIAAVAFAVGVHTVAPRIGRGLQDLLSGVKLFVLFFIVCTGFAALGGHLRVEKPHNLDVSTSFKNTSNSGYDIGTALLNAIFSYQGYDNLNAVLSEVKSPERTLRIALPTAMSVITVLYVLANIAYFAGVSREDFLASDTTIAASLFRNVYGHSAAVKALPALVALSAIGHLLGVAFAVSRLIQELAKDGVAPFPSILMQNRPFQTPIFSLAIHLGITILFICAPPAGDAFSFVVGLGTYPSVFLLTLITIGLIRIRFSKTDDFHPSFKSPWAVLAFYLAGSIFLLVMPFIPPNGDSDSSLPYYLSPVVALAILTLGVIYYVARFVLFPWVFNYELDLVAVDLSDGSQVSRDSKL
ncbi:uncharacterized protein N7459_007169 [Penicillium hispanicum]|uniref:uncharacterized protein n=1 Tax=Penicillium hispanicum TaxID=1080232 RepID=UPI00253FF672|nr:uncharacterized protein N7459_007169 [Penicillium hispanicum]KAJ5578205.1 hypothetical protein N7459_007169 [Penicillium hispanicum]